MTDRLIARGGYWCCNHQKRLRKISGRGLATPGSCCWAKIGIVIELMKPTHCTGRGNSKACKYHFSAVTAAEQQLWRRQLEVIDSYDHAVPMLQKLLQSADWWHVPSTKKLLQIMVTLSITSCSSKWAFFILHRLETYIRTCQSPTEWLGTANCSHR